MESIEKIEVPALEECLDAYWETGAQIAEVALEPAAPEVDLALLKRLGVPDFLPQAAFRAQMERVYVGVTERAIEVAYQESVTSEE